MCTSAATPRDCGDAGSRVWRDDEARAWMNADERVAVFGALASRTAASRPRILAQAVVERLASPSGEWTSVVPTELVVGPRLGPQEAEPG